MEEKDLKPNTGIVTSRKCPHCGHNEIGYRTPDGEFHALKPGSLVQVLMVEEPQGPALETMTGLGGILPEGEDQETYRPWVPDPLTGSKKLRLKYGVMVKEGVFDGPMAGDIYRSAYIKKLEGLIEKETRTPLPVILDRFFSSAHLASGNPRQIAQAMYRELDEIQNPARLMTEWLERQDDESLAKVMALPVTEPSTEGPVSEEALAKELEDLSLEGFLVLLED